MRSDRPRPQRKKTALQLHCILPCEGQEVKWTVAERVYHSILQQAGEAVYVSRAYHSDCMPEHNRYMYMVDRASFCRQSITIRAAAALARL